MVGDAATYECAEVVRDDPTNNVPDSIFAKLGMQLHRRDQHPIGILKNAIFDYFDSSYPTKFAKFDNLCPIVSVKAVSQLVHQGIMSCISVLLQQIVMISCLHIT